MNTTGVKYSGALNSEMEAEYISVGGRTYYTFEELPTQSTDMLETDVATRPYVQTLGLSGSDKPRMGFWERRTGSEVTFKQKRFDWIFGVIFPVICFAFDPIVFKGSFGDSALLGFAKPFAYLQSFSCVMATMAWLLWGEKLKWLNAFLAGLLFVGGVAALCVAVVLTPFSLVGLLLLIGALGLTPWLTSFVFIRNAVRAFNAAKPFVSKKVLFHSFALSAIACLTIPLAVNAEIKRSVARIVDGDVATIQREARILSVISPLVDMSPVEREYNRTPEGVSPRNTALGAAHEKITGKPPRPYFD